MRDEKCGDIVDAVFEKEEMNETVDVVQIRPDCTFNLYILQGRILDIHVKKHSFYFFSTIKILKKQEDFRNSLVLLGVTPLLHVAQ